MQTGAVHCHCSKCYSVPARKRVRKRSTPITLLSLPEEIILYLLQSLSAEDLLSVRGVNSHLRDIVDNHSSVWARVSFREKWPCPKTLWLFEKAAEKGNFEAAVKLGIAYLYNEGPLLCDEGRADVCGQRASHFFSLAESLRSPKTDPFTWVFIRPPWSSTGSCCKAVVFDHLKAECENNPEKRGSLLHCLARVMLLFEEEEKRSNAITMLEESSRAGCLQSSYLLWQNNLRACLPDPGRYLECVRTLRDYAAKGCWEAQLSLAKVCSIGNPLGLESSVRANVVAQLFSSSNLAAQNCPQSILRRGMKDTMRYILVDWLVEVTTMKDFSSQILHVTVGCVDRYLDLCSVPKACLQLLGIACMVVCTRYFSTDILTIREAVWLTDNTYKYEDLVRMMGEVVSVLGGKIRSPTLLDYGEILLFLLPQEKRTAHLFSYICELSLLYSAFTVPSPAKLASAALLLTRALHHYGPVWPSVLADYTGFTKQDLIPLAVLLYVKCFSQDVPRDYRHASLTGIKQRFEDETFDQISKEKVMDFKELCQILEIPEEKPQMETSSPTGSQTIEIHTFLASPSNAEKRRRDDIMHDDRGSFVATPTVELSNQEEMLLGDILDWSLETSCSGYEGDLEEESEADKDCDTSMTSIALQVTTDANNQFQNCRALSSDEDSFCETDDTKMDIQSQESSCRDFHSSGYSSVQSGSPASNCSTSSLMSYTFKSVNTSLGEASANAQPGFRLLVPMQRPRGCSTKQVKRKNVAAHSGGEVETEDDLEEEFSSNGGFLSV